MQYDVKTGYPVQFAMYSKSPLSLDDFKSYVKDSKIIPFFSGKTNANGAVTFKGELPSNVSEIYSYSTAIGVPVLMKATVDENGVVSGFTAVDPASVKTRASGSGPSGTSFWKTYSISLAKPTLAAVSREITSTDKDLIDVSFPEDQNYDVVKSYYRPSISLAQEATVKIYSVKHGATSNRTNALAYFTYTGDDKSISPEKVNSTMQLVFPELTKTSPAEGSGYQLLYNGEQKFPANSKIGFALLPDINPGNIATENIHLLYSCFNYNIWNTYSYPADDSGKGLSKANVPHMVVSLLKVEANGHATIAIAFEDQPFSGTHGTNVGNFRDDIFILEIDPASAVPDLPTPPTEEPEYDNKYISNGILIFEDCWPNIGDYDLNDVMLSYQRSSLYSNTKGLVKIEEDFTFLNNGAGFSNGFGYQLMGVSQSNIVDCVVESDFKCPGQGLDKGANSNEALIMLFDNGKNVAVGTKFKVSTKVKEGTFISGVNPFIVVERSGKDNDMMKKERLEVHLPTPPKSAVFARFSPTSKASTIHFGTYADKSDVKNNVFYVRSGNYPFALDLNFGTEELVDFSKFVIPQEGKTIDQSYPDFTKWVDSNGKSNQDWFLHPKGSL